MVYRDHRWRSRTAAARRRVAGTPLLRRKKHPTGAHPASASATPQFGNTVRRGDLR
jgi:hypothetical protein